MNWDEIPEIDLYSDGGADPNPGKGGFGVVMSYKGQKKEFSEGYKLTTNNRMELMGVIYGLERLKTKSIVNIYTDSRYVIDGITKGWAEKWKSNNWYRTKNAKAINNDLWDRLLTLISNQQEVRFNWVKGHSGHLENERCDELANFAINGIILQEDIGYKPEENSDSIEVSINNDFVSKSKINYEGDLCRKCNVPVIKKQTKKKPFKSGQTYYFDYFLFCPSCGTVYMTEAAKRNIDEKENTLFE
jgi:ribonuclease HI